MIYITGDTHRDFSWWDLELPIEEEMQNGISNLEKVNYKIDYVISNCCPTSIQALINPTYKRDALTDYIYIRFQKNAHLKDGILSIIMIMDK